MTGGKRAPQLPNLPTIGEAGVKGYAVTVWFGMLAPAKTPQDIINKVQGEIARGIQGTQLRERLIALGAEPSGNTSEEFAAFIKSIGEKIDYVPARITTRSDRRSSPTTKI